MIPRRPAAFTLIEIIVVIGIVTVAFISLIALVHRAIGLYYNNKNILIANALAQEGLELARYIRDDNWMSSQTYSTELYFSFQLNLSGTNAQQPGSKKIIAIDPRVVNNRLTAREAGSFPGNPACFWDNATPKQCSNSICDATDEAGLKECLKLSAARLYQDTSNASNIINRYVLTQAPYNETLDPAVHKYTGFNRLIFTEYRDGGVAGNDDDYVHIESWVYWVDRGREKYFHIDTDLYDYSWRYDK